MDAYQEQVDVEGGNSVEAQSSEDVNTSVEESEDIDGQGLDGDDDLGIQADKHVDGGLSIYGSLWMVGAYELLSKYDCLKERRANVN